MCGDNAELVEGLHLQARAPGCFRSAETSSKAGTLFLAEYGMVEKDHEGRETST
jgi:hypothetical protein